MPEDAELEARIAAALDRYRSAGDATGSGVAALTLPAGAIAPSTTRLVLVMLAAGGILFTLLRLTPWYVTLVLGAALYVPLGCLLLRRYEATRVTAERTPIVCALPDHLDLQVNGVWQPHAWAEVTAVELRQARWELTLGDEIICLGRTGPGLAIANAAREVLRERQRLARELAGVPEGALSPAERLTDPDAEHGLSRADA